MSSILEAIGGAQERALALRAQQLLGGLIQKDQYVGEVFSLGYETALVQIHDFHRKQVGGIPSLSFLVATRISPGAEIRFEEEDSSVILLRVMDAAPLPNDAEALRLRAESAQRVSGDGFHWDEQPVMDPTTHHALSFAGINCRVIGTFFLDEQSNGLGESLILRFGSDLSNFYPNRGLKVFKPNGEALSKIVNYRDSDRVDELSLHNVTIGEIRYASTNRVTSLDFCKLGMAGPWKEWPPSSTIAAG